ncbi:MAG: EscU/YscU/HrcU family type III secretion system export apparatus switch protein [Planctomycetaceae bacterium]|nr:EscU/YscU/HrcU family type III secretion system export apparatus switch protein [Planctomycetaceae bacterium]
MADETTEKTQQPTPLRRQRAREAGEFAKSQELVSAAVLLAGVAALYWLGNSAALALRDFTAWQLGNPGDLALDPEAVIAGWQETLRLAVPIVLPLAGIALGAAVIFNLLQTGLVWRPQAVVPSFARISPATGLRRLVSLPNGVHLLQAAIKLAIVAGVAGRSLYLEHRAIVGLAALDVPQLAQFVAGTLLWILLEIAAVLFGLALADYAYQWWRHEQSLKMTPAEMREELRNQQGDPQVAARRRAIQRQQVQQRPEAAIPRAHVVVAQGTARAVALRYDPESMPAPIVVAKGSGALAGRIGRLALEHGVPILEDQELAVLLDQQGALNQPVPRHLFARVADTLALARHRARRAGSPELANR